MKGKKVIVIGNIVLFLGLIFHLQGQSIVGPESSFMYSNPQWVTYGIEISILGGIILVIGVSLNFFKKG